jgi:hypothetical protein
MMSCQWILTERGANEKRERFDGDDRLSCRQAGNRAGGLRAAKAWGGAGCSAIKMTRAREDGPVHPVLSPSFGCETLHRGTR